VKEGRPIHERRKRMMKIIAAAASVAAPWQPAHAQAIVASIPEEFRGDWCQESTKDNIFKPGGCKLKVGSLSIDRMTLDTGRLSCGFDSGTASDGTLQMRMLCTDPEDNCGCRASLTNSSAFFNFDRQSIDLIASNF
jgi:hypothetical protein